MTQFASFDSSRNIIEIVNDYIENQPYYKIHKLRVNWTVELEQDLISTHGIVP